jgi:hypothetical protein
MAQDEEPQFSADLTVLISNAELDRLIAELATHPLAEGEARPVVGGVYVDLPLSRSVP